MRYFRTFGAKIPHFCKISPLPFLGDAQRALRVGVGGEGKYSSPSEAVKMYGRMGEGGTHTSDMVIFACYTRFVKGYSDQILY